MVTEPSKSTVSDTRRRLLEAATRVFAQSGLEGATTREIARAAKVNEVTLFRHFQSKENLLTAVLQRTFDQQDATIQTDQKTLGETTPTRSPADLRAGLQHHARKYEELLQSNILLLRTLIGEIHRHTEHEARVLKGIFAPLKADMAAMILQAREQGTVRAEIDPATAADLFSGMIFMDVMRRSMHNPAASYFDAALDVFLHGIETPA